MPEAERLVLGQVVKNPQYSTQQISQSISLGPHRVYNLLKKLNLTTFEKRLAYAKAHQEVTPTFIPKPAPFIIPSIGRIPVISNIPPPPKYLIYSFYRT